MNEDIKRENSADNGGQEFDAGNIKDDCFGKESGEPLAEIEKSTDAQEESAACSQEEADDKQEETARAQDGDTCEQAESDKQEHSENVTENVTENATENATQNATYVASYTPPYYAPNFTMTPSGAYVNLNNKYAAPKKNNVGLIVALSVVCSLLIVAVVVLASAFFSKVMLSNGFGSGDSNIDILLGNKEVNTVDTGEQGTYTIPQIVDKVADSVVEITTRQVTHNPVYGDYVTGGAGSGVIFAQEGTTGYIVTNYHVIAGADEVVVTVKIGDEQKQYYAKYLAGDNGEDIAVITIQLRSGESLCLAEFRDLEKSPLQVGESVLAIGNPLGQLGGTVTNGIISALDREISISGNKMVLLQTNAAVNPGNSGGGLFDSSGMLIGIVNAKESETGIEGLGFAIPVNKVLADITDIFEKGYITGRVSLGIYVYTVNSAKGVYIYEDSGEFKANDRLIAINGEAIDTVSDYNAALENLTIGETITVTVLRRESFVTIEVKVVEDTSR